MRISPDELFIGVADLIAKRSTCNRGQVGAVIVRERRIIATGYNGAPPGQPECLDEGCLDVDLAEEITKSIMNYDKGKRWAYEYAATAATGVLEKRGVAHLGCSRAIHAEANALAFAARHGTAVAGATMYCTHGACLPCAQLMVSAGIKTVMYCKPYRDLRGIDLLVSCGVHVERSSHGDA